MPTIDDIQFNDSIYGNAMNLTLLLYQLNEISVVIQLPNANLMSFICVFNDSIKCQELIDRNPRKMITLFAYEKNIQQWLTNNMNIPSNLQNIKIFCHSDDQFYINEWTNRYRHRFNNFDVINFENLNYNLLSFGLEHIQRLRQEFQDDFGILNLLDRDYKHICHCLGNYALQRANIEDERIRQSCEAQS
jgi:hypothetical protein